MKNSHWIWKACCAFFCLCLLLIWFRFFGLVHSVARFTLVKSCRFAVVNLFSPLQIFFFRVYWDTACGYPNCVCNEHRERLREFRKLAMSWVKEFSNCMKDICKTDFFPSHRFSRTSCLFINRKAPSHFLKNTNAPASHRFVFIVIECLETWNKFHAGLKIY